MRNDGVTVFDLLHIDKVQSNDPVILIDTSDTTEDVAEINDSLDQISVNATEVKSEPIRISKVDVGLRDKILRCKDCDNDFIYSFGEQTYYKQHNLIDPTRCPDCREKAKQAREVIPTDAPESNSVIIAKKAKKLLLTLKENNLTLEQFESILNVYLNSNSFVLDLVRTFEDIVISDKDTELRKQDDLQEEF